MDDPGLRERMGRRMHGVHRMGQGFVVHQMGVANKLSYMALDDLMFPGVVSLDSEKLLAFFALADLAAWSCHLCRALRKAA